MLPTNMKLQNASVWKMVVVMLMVEMMCSPCHAQTFQYSRGWTNGKRSGASRVGYLPGQGSSRVFEVDGGVLSVPLEDPSVSVSVPATHMNLSPQGRVRSLDYNQIVNRKMSSFANRKQPLWIGTLMGADQEASLNNSADF